MKELMPGGLHFLHWVVVRAAVDLEKDALGNVGETNQPVTGRSGGSLAWANIKASMHSWSMCDLPLVGDGVARGCKLCHRANNCVTFTRLNWI